MKTIISFAIFIGTIARILANPSQLSYAEDLQLHELNDKAIEAYISLYYQSKDKDEKAQCLFSLGKISLRKGKIETAVKDWTRLTKEFPNSEQSIEVKGQLDKLLQSSQEEAFSDIKSAIAISYLKHASFFSDNSERWRLDTSYIPAEEVSAYWCDRVIKEFPNTKAHEIALKKKFFAYLGWKDQYSGFGLKHSASTYMPKLIGIFSEMKNTFPNSGSLPAMSFQIAQYYWPRTDPEKAREWFTTTQQLATKGSYYYELVRYRLENWNERR